MELHTILVPTDFSPCADHALERAVEMAKVTQATLHILHAYQLPPGAGMMDVPLPRDYQEQIRDAAQQCIDERVKRASDRGVKANGQVTCDVPVRAILDAVAKVQADLIMMGTHGRTGIKHMLLGSVAERTVRLAPCSVMTVKLPSNA